MRHRTAKKWALAGALLAAILALGAPAGAQASAATAKAAVLKKFPKLPKTTVVRQSEIPGLYEVNLYGRAAYTDEKASFMLTGGSLISTQTLEDLTKKGAKRHLRDGFLGIPKDLAIKTVYGKGERSLVVFENPDCPNCQRQHEIWAKNPEGLNATVYTFLVELKSKPDSARKAAFIACSKSPGALWGDWMAGRGGLPLEKSPDGSMRLAAGADASCPSGTEHLAAARQVFEGFEFTGTPSFIFENGWTGRGWMSLEEFESAFAKVRQDLEDLK